MFHHKKVANQPQIQESQEVQDISTNPSEDPINLLKHKWLALATLALAVSLIVMDGTIVNVALPVMMEDLSLSFVNAEWVITLYALVFSALLITTGRLADTLGRIKCLLAGLVVFMVGAVICALGSDLTWLLVGRFVQGIGGALVLPTTLSTINTLYKGRDRIMAFAVYGSVIAGMAAIGPLLGGVFTTYTTWRWIFWVDLPVGIVVLLGAIFFTPETMGEKFKGKFDWWGLLFSASGFGFIVYALIEGQNYGWWKPAEDAPHWGGISPIPYLFVIGIVCLILMIAVEMGLIKRGRSHLISLNLFVLKSFSMGNVIAIILSIAEYGLVFLIPIYLQNVLMFDAMTTGWVLCVLGVGAFLAGGFAEPFVRFTTPRIVVITGLVLEAIAFAGFFFFVHATTNLGLIIFWLFLYGFGLGFTSAQLTSIVMSAIPDSKAGQGSSIQSTVRQLGSALGIAIIGVLFLGFLNLSVPHSLDNIKEIPEPARVGITTAVIESGGRAIGPLEHDPELKQLPADVQKQFKADLEGSFTRAAMNTLGVMALLLLLGLALSIALPTDSGSKKEIAKEEAKLNKYDKEWRERADRARGLKEKEKREELGEYEKSESTKKHEMEVNNFGDRSNVIFGETDDVVLNQIAQQGIPPIDPDTSGTSDDHGSKKVSDSSSKVGEEKGAENDSRK